MEVCVLASGSAGNCVAISGGGTNLLVDLGLIRKHVLIRMEEAKIDPTQLSGILFTHNHGDHCKGVGPFENKFKTPLYANWGTAEDIRKQFPKVEMNWSIFENGQRFSIGAFEVETFQVPHDAADPVGFRFHQGGKTLFLAIDLGFVTTMLKTKLKDCDAAIVESNHDHEMLEQSDRPYSLKSRIRGRDGHLSNTDSAEFVSRCASERLRRVMLAHLSHECNTPTLAERTMKAALAKVGRTDVEVTILEQDRISPWFEI